MIFDPTGFLNAISNLLSLAEHLSPAILDWIEARIPAEKQNIITRRMRKCKRICRKENLNAEMIARQTNILFADLTAQQQQDISALLTYELLKPTETIKPN